MCAYAIFRYIRSPFQWLLLGSCESVCEGVRVFSASSYSCQARFLWIESQEFMHSFSVHILNRIAIAIVEPRWTYTMYGGYWNCILNILWNSESWLTSIELCFYVIYAVASILLYIFCAIFHFHFVLAFYEMLTLIFAWEATIKWKIRFSDDLFGIANSSSIWYDLFVEWHLFIVECEEYHEIMLHLLYNLNWR